MLPLNQSRQMESIFVLKDQHNLDPTLHFQPIFYMPSSENNLSDPPNHQWILPVQQSYFSVQSEDNITEDERTDNSIYKAIEERYLLRPEDLPSLGFPAIDDYGNVNFFGFWKNPIKMECRLGEVQCSRCSIPFDPFKQEQMGSFTSCCFHPDRFDRKLKEYPCCQKDQRFRRCFTNNFHVWSGVRNGLNGPFDRSIFQRFPSPNTTFQHKVFAIDCEMSFTAIGMEVTNVSVVNLQGQLVYYSTIRPLSPIIDYNTRYSGITPQMMDEPGVKSLPEVQRDLMAFIDSDTILVGHAIHNDLRALRFLHEKIVDTSVIFPHPLGLPYRMSLKTVVQKVLMRAAQTNETGHSSFEDSRDCIEALMAKLRYDEENDRQMLLNTYI